MIKRKGIETMAKVSPFLVQKVIENVCGHVIQCFMARDESLIVETTGVLQAAKLMQLIQISKNVQVEVMEKENMNQSKEVIYARELLCDDDDSLLEYLKDQHVVKVERLKKRLQNGNFEDVGIFFITFGVTQLPETLKAGYMKYNVRPYVPKPMHVESLVTQENFARTHPAVLTARQLLIKIPKKRNVKRIQHALTAAAIIIRCHVETVLNTRSKKSIKKSESRKRSQ